MALTFLITGGAGFIGSHLAIALARQDYDVRILDNFSTSSKAKFQTLLEEADVNIDIVDGDLRDRAACQQAVIEADFVLHHAAMASVPASIAEPDVCAAINFQGTANLLMEIALQKYCKRVVFASSSAVYGDVPGYSKLEEAIKDPLSPYATTKLAGEYLMRNYYKIHGLETVSLRYFNVFGARQNPNGPYAAAIPKFTEAIEAGKSPIIFGDGYQSRDFVSVEDVVRANLLACFASSDKVAGEVFNIGSGRKTTLNQLVDVLGDIFGRSVAPIYEPARKGDILHSLADISKAEADLDYRPKWTLEEGLKALVS